MDFWLQNCFNVTIKLAIKLFGVISFDLRFNLIIYEFSGHPYL